MGSACLGAGLQPLDHILNLPYAFLQSFSSSFPSILFSLASLTCAPTARCRVLIILSKEEIAHLYQGGVLSVKIKGEDTDISVEIFCKEFSERKGTRIRFKTIDAE